MQPNSGGKPRAANVPKKEPPIKSGSLPNASQSGAAASGKQGAATQRSQPPAGPTKRLASPPTPAQIQTVGRWQREKVTVTSAERPDLYPFEGLTYSLARNTLWLGDDDDIQITVKQGRPTSVQLDWLLRANDADARNLPLPRMPVAREAARTDEALLCGEHFPSFMIVRNLLLIDETSEVAQSQLSSSALPRKGIPKTIGYVLDKVYKDEASPTQGGRKTKSRAAETGESDAAAQRDKKRGMDTESSFRQGFNGDHSNPKKARQSHDSNENKALSSHAAVDVLLKRLPVWPVSKDPDVCRCSRSNCLKRYCPCFAAQKHCGSSCACRECYNRFEYRESQWEYAYLKSVERGDPRKGTSCRCSGTTHCLKRYCDCYDAGMACTSACSCVDCRNLTSRVNDDDTE